MIFEFILHSNKLLGDSTTLGMVQQMDDFNEKKFRELIVYIARRLGPEAALGRVKLAKLLMASDFGAYERFGRSITGATYENWEHGHLPQQMLLAQRDLEAAGAIKTEAVDFIERALRIFGYESASFLSAQSHLELGWRLTDWREPIPFRTVFLGAGDISEGDIRRGEELASLHGWN